MNKRKIYIAVFIVSVIGLFVVQYQYLRIGLNLAKVQFNQKLVNAGQEISSGLSNENRLTFLLGKAITNEEYFKLSLDSVQDASSFYLQDFLREKLATNGIDNEFSYALTARDSTEYLTSEKTFANKESIINYPIPLNGYLPGLVQKRLILELKFEDLNSYFISQLSGLTIPSLIFMTAIIFVVIWVLKSFYWQSSVITTTNEFINNLTHELKTPVFSIGLATKILEEKGEQPAVVQHIRKQVERLKKHIDQVLELASLESKKNVFALEKTDLKPYLETLCEEFRLLSNMEDVRFTYRLEPGPYTVKAQVAHLENALNNILDNARKYSAEPIIELKAKRESKNLRISIVDNGIGLDKKDKDRIFEKFYRVSEGNNHKVKGYGLGLSYVKKIMKLHKGKIEVESEKDKGTSISLIIPLYHAS